MPIINSVSSAPSMPMSSLIDEKKSTEKRVDQVSRGVFNSIGKGLSLAVKTLAMFSWKVITAPLWIPLKVAKGILSFFSKNKEEKPSKAFAEERSHELVLCNEDKSVVLVDPKGEHEQEESTSFSYKQLLTDFDSLIRKPYGIWISRRFEETFGSKEFEEINVFRGTQVGVLSVSCTSCTLMVFEKVRSELKKLSENDPDGYMNQQDFDALLDRLTEEVYKEYVSSIEEQLDILNDDQASASL